MRKVGTMSTGRWYIASLLSALLVLGVENAALAQKKPAPKPKPPVGTIGTKPMAGGDGQIGVPYSLKEVEFFGGFNITIHEVSYSLDRLPINDTAYIPRRDQKLLIVRFQLQNPTKEDIQFPGFNGGQMLFQAVANDNKTYEPGEYGQVGIERPGLPLGKAYASANLVLKPGQKSEMLVACIPIPADATVPKLVVKRGRVGTSEEVMRFDLRGKIKPNFGLFANAAAPETPLPEIKAEAGKFYHAGVLDLQLDSVKFEGGPLKPDFAADEGKRFFTGIITYRGAHPVHRGTPDTKILVTLVDADGEKTNFDSLFWLKPTRPEEFDWKFIEPGEERKVRFFFQIPRDLKVKQIQLGEWNFPDYETRRMVYDVSNTP
jgi:hypothetical protein